MEHDTRQRNWLAPFVTALVAVAIVYATSLAMVGTRMPALVAALAIVAAIAAYLVCRVVQMRGRVTLAMAVIGLPLLTAIIFSTAALLAPFAERQEAYDRLRAAGIQCHLREGETVGEWIQDRQGNTLPLWVANRIGPDCMKELFTIQGALQDLQSFEYREIDGSTIRYVTIDVNGFDGDVEVSQDFAQWVRELPRFHCMSVNLGFQYGDEQTAVVTPMVQLIDGVLKRDSRGLVGAGSHFRLQAPTLPAETIDALTKLPPGINLLLGGGKLNARMVESLSAQQIGMLSLDSVGLPDLASIPTRDEPSVQQVHVFGGPVSLDQLRHLARVFQCERLTVESNQVSEEQIVECWRGMSGDRVRVLKVYRPSNRPLRFTRPREE